MPTGKLNSKNTMLVETEVMANFLSREEDVLAGDCNRLVAVLEHSLSFRQLFFLRFWLSRLFFVFFVDLCKYL
jgi:hypothetical protein